MRVITAFIEVFLVASVIVFAVAIVSAINVWGSFPEYVHHVRN